MMGYPIALASSLGSLPIGPSDPGTIGRPIFFASFFADILLPIVCIISEEGPAN